MNKQQQKINKRHHKDTKTTQNLKQESFVLLFSVLLNSESLPIPQRETSLQESAKT